MMRTRDRRLVHHFLFCSGPESIPSHQGAIIMSVLTNAHISGSEPGLADSSRSLIRWVSCNNPFYAISALLVCLGLWVSFGGQAQAAETWALMAGMTGYTLLLAVTACLLVRFLGVWDDVRTVMLLTVLMFLATSVTFDEVLAVAPEARDRMFRRRSGVRLTILVRGRASSRGRLPGVSDAVYRTARWNAVVPDTGRLGRLLRLCVVAAGPDGDRRPDGGSPLPGLHRASHEGSRWAGDASTAATSDCGRSAVHAGCVQTRLLALPFRCGLPDRRRNGWTGGAAPMPYRVPVGFPPCVAFRRGTDPRFLADLLGLAGLSLGAAPRRGP